MRTTRSSSDRVALSAAAGLLLACAPAAGAAGAIEVPGEAIRFDVSPRLCTLAQRDKQCDTVVHLSWSAAHEEALCLVLVGRPEIKRCWEHYAAGTYSLELVFAQDLTFELRDPALRDVLATTVLRVIREALQYRPRRRQPWNVFD